MKHSIMHSSKEIVADIARELRAHPERWCQGPSAMNAEGHEVGSNEDDAVAWCLEGHVWARTQMFALPVSTFFLLRAALGQEVLFSWNDAPGRTVSDVIQLCEKAAGIPS